jgi:hypothetical protein
MPHSCRLAAVFAVLVAWAACRADEPTADRPDARLPNVPGAFHAYNAVVGGADRAKHKGHFHSPISEFGLEPMVMIFTRKVEFSDPLKDLLKQLDAMLEKNPGVRLHPFVVVQSDELPDVVGADNAADDKRIELAQALEDEAKGLMLQHIDIDLAGKADLEKYKLDEYGFAFYLFRRGKVESSRLLKKEDELSNADVKALMTLDVAPFGPVATALVVTRDKDLRDPLKALLKRLDDAAEKNPAARLHPVVAVLGDEASRVDLTAKLDEQTKALMLKHTDAVVALPSDLQRYDLGNAGFAFFLSQRGGAPVSGGEKKADKLTPDAANEVMKLLEEKAGATQK